MTTPDELDAMAAAFDRTPPDYMPTRDTREHRQQKPQNIEDLPWAEQQGPVALTVNLENCPISTLAAVGAALQAMTESSNVQLQRDGNIMTWRRQLNGGEMNARMTAARARYDLGADAYDKARDGGELAPYEQVLLEQYLEYRGLEMPTAKADA